MKDAITSLKQIIAYVDSESDKTAYETPWRGGERGKAEIIFFPKSTEEVQDIVTTCFEHAYPVIPQGGNTGLVYGGTPPAHTDKPPVIINLRNLNKLTDDIDPISQTVTVQGGMILENFKEQIEEQGYLFSVDMASKGSAQLAGAASTNAGGTNFLRYGGMREQVLGLKAVLADGSVLDTISNVQKDNTGFPLTQLFLGAEGTLGIITELKLKLHPLPKQKETALAAVKNMDAALSLLQSFKKLEELSAFELMSSKAYQLAVNRPGKSDPFEEDYNYYLLIELTSSKARTEAFDLEAMLMQQIETAFESGIIQNAIVDKPAIIWGIRESITEAASHEGKVIPNDISVPILKIPEFLAKAEQMITRNWPELSLEITYFGHLGDGNLHYNLLQPKGAANPITEEQKQTIEDAIAELVIATGGSPVAEHGIGRKNIHAFQQYKNPVALELMKHIKQVLDPKNIMNPYGFFGKF